MNEFYFPVVASFIAQHPFNRRRVSVGEVLKELRSGNFDLTGTDQIPVKYVKLVGGLLMSPFTHIINVCLSTRQFAHTRKTAARISPVSRIDHPRNEIDYRPVSLFSLHSHVRAISAQALKICT